MHCLHIYMNAIIFPILQVRKQSTERLSNLPEITQQIGSRARMRTRLAGTRGHLAEFPLGAHTSAMKGSDATDSALPWFTAQARSCNPFEK